MFVVNRKLGTVRKLNDVEKLALLEFQRTGESAGATTLLRNVHRDSYWIACDCVEPRPVLNIALLEGGRYVLRNNPTCEGHALTCSFIKAETSVLALPRPSSNLVIERIHPETFIPLHVKRSTQGTGVSASGKGRRLLALLLSMIERAGICIYDPSKPVTISSQYAALRDSAMEFSMAGGTPFGGWLDTHIEPQRLVSMAKRLRAVHRQSAVLKWGAMLDVVGQIGTRSITSSGGHVMPFYGRYESQFRSDSPTLALVTIAELDRPGYFELCHVASMPVLSKSNLFPVVSAAERAPLKELFSIADWIYKTSGKPLILRRNIFDPVAPHLIELRSNKVQVVIDLSSDPLSSLIPDSDSSLQNILKLSELGSIAKLKKVIASKVLKPDAK